MVTTQLDAPLAGLEGLYKVAEAARIIHVDLKSPEARTRVTSSHLVRWIRSGFADRKLIAVPGRELFITFEDLVSMRVVAFLRSLGYSFHKVRNAERQLREVTHHPRPFATETIWAEEEGATHIFAEMAHGLLAVSQGRQLAFIELVRDQLINVHGLTFNEQHVANTWAPRRGILLNPKIQFGSPCIAGTRIPTRDVAGMVFAGDSKEYIARSYSITIDELQAAIDWEQEIADP